MRPGFTVLLFFGQAIGLFEPARVAHSEEPTRTIDGWYSSGVGRERLQDSESAGKSLPRSRRNNLDSTDVDRVPTPIVPYHSTLFGSSRNDFPSAPAAATHQYAAPTQSWNVATPPVVDLGRDFGVAAPGSFAPAASAVPTAIAPRAVANPYEIQPAVAPQAASIAPPVTEQRSLPSATPVIIDAGTLVPVHLPQREEQAPSHKEQSPDIQPAARKPSTQSLSKTETSQSAGQLTPVDNGQTNDKIESQPAPTTASKKIPKVTKASEAGAKSSSARARGNGQASPKELQPSARERREGFALPQPAIPLEGRLLRKLFGF